MYFLAEFITFLFYVPIGVVEGCIQILWFLVYLTMIFFSLFLITIEDTIYCVLFLIGIFLGAAFLLLILKAEFLAFMFLIVYVGAIAVFFLFIVMMINFKLQSKLNTGEVLAGFFFLSIFFLISIYLLPITRASSFIFNENINIITHIKNIHLEPISLYSNWARHLNNLNIKIPSSSFLANSMAAKYANDLLLNLEAAKNFKLFDSINLDALRWLLPSKDIKMPYFFNNYYFFKEKIPLTKVVSFSYSFNSFNNLRLVENFKNYEGMCVDNCVPLHNFTNIQQIGLFLYTYDLIAFVLCGFVLLVAILGCVILTVEVKLIGHRKQNLTDQLLKRHVQVSHYFSNN